MNMSCTKRLLSADKDHSSRDSWTFRSQTSLLTIRQFADKVTRSQQRRQVHSAGVVIVTLWRWIRLLIFLRVVYMHDTDFD